METSGKQKQCWTSEPSAWSVSHIRPLAAADRARFVESWARVQARFVDGPGGAVTEADQLLIDVMSTRGYPMADFEQRVADISVDHPVVLDNYRSAHETALRQTRGQARTEDLRQAMIHYRTLFEELVNDTAGASVDGRRPYRSFNEVSVAIRI